QNSRRVEDQVRVRGACVGSAPLSHALDDEGSTGTHTVPSGRDIGDLGVVISDRSPHELAPSRSPTRAFLAGSTVDLADVADVGVDQVKIVRGVPSKAIRLGTPDVLTGCTFSRGNERVNQGRRSPVVTVDRNRKDVPTNLVDVQVQVRPV